MRVRKFGSKLEKLRGLFRQFLKESIESTYEVQDIYDCPELGCKKADVKLSGRHIVGKNVRDIVMDIDFLEGFDKKTIRALTYMATLETISPDYSIVVQQMGSEVDDFILEIKSKNGKQVEKMSPIEISKDKALISKLSPIDANQIGYLAGIKETAREYNLKKMCENIK